MRNPLRRTPPPPAPSVDFSCPEETLHDLPRCKDEPRVKSIPPYSGPATICPKCAHSGATSHFHVEQAVEFLCGGTIRTERPEFLLRTCENCEYAWTELPLDHPGPDDASQPGPDAAV